MLATYDFLLATCNFLQVSAVERTRQSNEEQVIRLQNRFATLTEDCYFDSADDWDCCGDLKIGRKCLFSCRNQYPRKRMQNKRMKESEDDRKIKVNKSKSVNLFDILREHPEEDISRILSRLEVLRIPRKSLQKCKKCNYKKRKCTLYPLLTVQKIWAFSKISLL